MEHIDGAQNGTQKIRNKKVWNINYGTRNKKYGTEIMEPKAWKWKTWTVAKHLPHCPEL